MLDRLNGWQRIGVVLTALWVVFVLCTGALEYAGLETGRGAFVETVKGKEAYCTAPAPEAAPGQKTFTYEELHGCAPGAIVAATPDQHRFMWGAFALAAVIPAILAWLLAYMLIAVVRWVAKGFRRKAT